MAARRRKRPWSSHAQVSKWQESGTVPLRSPDDPPAFSGNLDTSNTPEPLRRAPRLLWLAAVALLAAGLSGCPTPPSQDDRPSPCLQICGAAGVHEVAPSRCVCNPPREAGR